ncbi:SDR family NAD(P)-dependent oxidoreductase [Pseudonocardia pini]|uniref:SDR family NAD(P)-dependent oxidoreductase n=1 Tax=Pseudonocardia pini TaxID=2758030 RepID=UPI0015F062DF|nr:SDR family NAD(P)-dependent oxidoreductase [Pseudonocardia pini]
MTAQRVLVTGGASGMGAGAVQGFVAAGAHVVSCDITEDGGSAIATEATAQGPGEAHFVPCDVADAASVTAAFDRAAELLGGLDVLVHAAGIAPGSAAAEIDPEQWDRIFAVNARGTMLTNQAAHRLFAGAGGRIINFASGAGAHGYPGKAHYAATKGAVLAWTRSIAHEWGPEGITVNALAPAIATPMYAATRASMTAHQLAAHDASLGERMAVRGALGDVRQDLVPVLLFLASPGAGFVTGQLIAVDGGMLMVR